MTFSDGSNTGPKRRPWLYSLDLADDSQVEHADPEMQLIERYVTAIRADRRDGQATDLSIRDDDVRVLGKALDLGEMEIVRRLRQLGVSK